MEQVWVSTPNINVSVDYKSEDYTIMTVIQKFKGKHILFTGTPEEFIYWLFNSRCIMCRRPATEINEIEPRSRSRDALKDFRNRVTLCADCHRNFHENGVTDEKQRIMRMNREIFLIALGRKDYI